jgi:Protein of unknown function (DUF1553)/Protein of unknown function (DUF1549)/Bacterial Ig-like domain (group 2)
MPRLLTVAAALLAATATFAQDPLPPNAKVTGLAVHPAAVTLAGPFAYSQLLVTATLDTGDRIDATRLAKFDAGSLATVSPNGLARPKADGTGTVTVTYAGHTAAVPLVVSNVKTTPTVSFVADVQPVLSKLGCNQGTCHGAAQGKNGFKLSLRGYDPVYDHRALTDDLEGRRFNRAAPDRSLMLLKPTGAVPHAGGGLWQPGDPYYETTKAWITQGVKQDLSAAKVTAIEVFPKNPTLPVIGGRQQFAVVATYANGTRRDVSAEAFVESSNTDVATVDKAGLMTGARRGEATMLARYEGAYAASTVIVMGDRTGFAWAAPPQFSPIDALVDKKLQRIKVLPSGLCDDSEFLRRVYIDLTGLPPSAAEVRAFLADPTPTQAKRDAVVDKLVGGEAYIDHWSNKWADLLQVNRKFLGDPGAVALRKWIRDQVAKNTPYDQFCYQVLTASGSNVENPPAAYYKTLREPDAVMENTTQLFLAVRFNCNKCHDHPFEKWTQDQYYQMAAFFAQVGRAEDPKYKGQRVGGTAVEGAKPLVEVISDAKGGEVKHDRTGQVTAPAFPFPHADLPAADLPRRVRAAKWITSPANPLFAKSYVNRVWSYLLGVGVIEPVDDIRAGNPPTNPELLDKLTADFVASKFDTRKLVTAICKSRTYQLSIAANKWNKDDDQNFARALPRRLPAEVLYDAVHATTGAKTRLPGVAPGTRAAQLLDSNVELPGGFLDLLGKPVRESACECERSNGMMLGPVLAFVSGPVVGDAVHDPANHIAAVTAAEKDDAKVVDEIYLSVLNRRPTAAEVTTGVTALRGAGEDHARLMADHWTRVAAFEAYKKTIDAKQAAWEAATLAQKPTTWTPLVPKTATSKAGPTPAAAKEASKLDIRPDGTVFVTGTIHQVDNYTVASEFTLPGAVTAVRLEALADPKLPNKGPGRAENGNFVLNELTANWKPAGADEKGKPVKFNGARATFEQGGFPAKNAIDNNRATGWAIADQLGRDQAAMFTVQAPFAAGKGGTLTVNFGQEYGSGHSLGKFRLSVTTDKNPKLASPVPADLAKLLDVPAAERTAAQSAAVRQRYLAQDGEYQRLAADAGKVPPADPRVLGAQDLAWALINTPAFLFNH